MLHAMLSSSSQRGLRARRLTVALLTFAVGCANRQMSIAGLKNLLSYVSVLILGGLVMCYHMLLKSIRLRKFSSSCAFLTSNASFTVFTAVDTCDWALLGQLMRRNG